MNSPKEVAQNYIETGIAKSKLPVGKALVLGVLAGMFIALAAAGATIASSTVASASLAKLISAVVFPGGLAMVVVAGSELFTGNCLIVIPVMQREAGVTGMLKNWLFVYTGNFIGSILVAALVVYGGTLALFSNAAAASAIHTAAGKVSLHFVDALFRGILCNFLVCIAVWMAFAAKDVVGKIIGVFFPVMLFVVSGFEHSIANMYYIATGLFASRNPTLLGAAQSAFPNDAFTNLTWGRFFAANLLPVTLGNIIGGVSVWAMMRAGHLRKPVNKQ